MGRVDRKMRIAGRHAPPFRCVGRDGSDIAPDRIAPPKRALAASEIPRAMFAWKERVS